MVMLVMRSCAGGDNVGVLSQAVGSAAVLVRACRRSHVSSLQSRVQRHCVRVPGRDSHRVGPLAQDIRPSAAQPCSTYRCCRC